MLGPVQVTASPQTSALTAEQKLTPGAVQIVNGDMFYQRAVDNVADALRYVPGVSMVSDTGGGSGVLSIRGTNLSAINYDNSGVMLLQDGLPITTADGANHNRLPDPLQARDIVVANGPNALTYGASDLGGAIDFISRTALNSDPDQLYLYGGNNGLGGGRFSTGGLSGDLDGMVTVEGEHFDGYQQQSRLNRFSVYGNTGWRVSDSLKLRLFTSYIDNRQQLAGSLTRAEFAADPRQADPSAVRGDHQLDVKTGRAAMIGTWTINDMSWLDFGVSYEGQSLYHPIVNVFNPTPPPVQFFSLLIDTTQRTSGSMVRYHLNAGDHKLLAGVNFAYTSDVGGNYENNAGQRGARTDDVDQRANNFTLFVMDRWQFASRWTLVYGTQGVVTRRAVRDVSLASGSTRDQQQTYSSINPRIGLIYALAKNSEAYANVSRVYEAPNNFDLNNDVRQDNSTLAAMQGMSYEVGTRGGGRLPFDASTWRWSLALYYAQIRNEILSVEDPTQSGTLLSQNYGKTVHAGVEALLGASFPFAGGANRIEPLVSITYNHFRFDDDPNFGSNQLPYAPDYAIHGEVMVRNRDLGLYAGPTFDWVGARYVDMANTYGVNGYALVGLRVGIARGRWELFAEARNLANKQYVKDVTVLTQADADARVLNAGAPRSVFVGMRLRY